MSSRVSRRPTDLDGLRVSSSEFADDDADELARSFSALADPTRLRLLSVLANAETGEVCSCDLATLVGRAQPTVSHHLRLLFEAGLVERQKRATNVWYRVVPERLEELRSTLL